MSLGSILSTAAPIAAGYFGGPALAGSFGMSAAGGAIAAGALTGAGIAALSGGDVLTSGVMGGLGGYAGGEMFSAATAAKEAAQGTLTDAAFNKVAQDQVMQQAGAGINSGITGTTGQLGANMGQINAPGVFGTSSIANPMAGATPTSLARSYPNIGTTGVSQGATVNQAYSPNFMATATKNVNVPTAQFGTDYGFSDIATELGGGDSVMGYGKLGLAGLTVLGSGIEPETFTYDQMKEAEAYDPDETLNLLDPELDSGIEDVINEDSGLRLYANQGGMVPTYAEGGTIESRADQGMKDALARNKGTAYTRPTTNASSNVNIAGADNSTSNLTGGVGSLNVNSGSIGQSANAIAAGAEAARLKAIEDAKPKIRVGPSMSGSLPTQYYTGGTGGFGYARPSRPTGWFGINQGREYAPGYAEGGTVETRADQGMRDALARNQGTAYTQPTTNASSNVNAQPALNINRGMGSLNVNSGSIGQSANAIAEAARLKAIEDAKPKALPLTYQQIQTGAPRGAILAGPLQNYDRFIDGSYRKRYAEGGTIESRAKEGMAGALARNEGIAYTRPTTAPVTTTAPSSIKIAGADNSTSNIGGGSTSNLTNAMGSLNVGSGSIGKSPDKALRDTHFKMLRGYEVPLDYTPATAGGQGNIYSGYTQPTQASHTYNRASKKWEITPPPAYNPFANMSGGGIGNQYNFQANQPQFSGYGGPEAGIAQYAEGGMLEGPGDGMSDSLAAQIDGSQPAALSQGEFVVPADVVSHLGNGSSDAGSKRLYAMMDEVRQARTGTEKQGKEINPERYMPA